MEIKDLVGKHKLDGVDFYSKEIESYGRYEDSEVCRFRLDGSDYDRDTIQAMIKQLNNESH